MRFSLRTVELLEVKFGKGNFCCFEELDESVMHGITEESAKRDFRELSKNGLITVSDDSIHLSALAHHICNMMIQPEQVVVLDNIEQKSIRIYVRDTYYLCVIENKNVTEPDDYGKYQFELLPKLDYVVGALAYALSRSDGDVASRDKSNQEDEPGVRILEKAWDSERNLISEVHIFGSFREEKIQCLIMKSGTDDKDTSEVLVCDISSLVNRLTQWLFDRISENYEGRD